MRKTTFKPQYNHHGGNLIQALFLKSIYKKPSYGYEIIKNTNRITDAKHEIKTGTAYTLLRRMEKSGLVKSAWEKNEQGPDKRVYAITRKGKEYLKIWLEFIIQRKKIINKLVSFYNKNFKVKP
ncbi:MAG: PadR family transcriptional regulator [Elusimicrobiota bacterium]|nr:PadR family transcriptional regulator [Elusimicrobiota bacterium]